MYNVNEYILSMGTSFGLKSSEATHELNTFNFDIPAIDKYLRSRVSDGFIMSMHNYLK